MTVFLPTPSRISEPFWAGCREGLLRMQQCDACHRFLFYPSYMCPHCGGSALSWKTISGRGQVHAFTASPGKDSEPPAVLCLVELDEGPIMMSRIVRTDPDEIAIGDRLTVTFEKVSDEISLPVFVPAH
jgi:uncharacterized OB-fold protein